MSLKKILAIISIFLMLVPFPACSSANKTLNWGSWGGGQKEKGIDQKSVNNFFENIRPASGNAEAHYLLACHFQERDRHREAVEEFRKSISINPNHVKAYNALGVSFDNLKIHAMAIESYKRALALNPNLDYVQNNLGYSYLLSGNFDEAAKAFQKAVALNPQDKRFHNNLALAYAEKGHFELALNEFKQVSDEANAHYNLAKICQKKGLYQEAKNHYALALELNPSSPVYRSGFRAASALAAVFDSKHEKSRTPIASVPTEPSPKAKDRDQGPRAAEVPESSPGKEVVLKAESHPEKNNGKKAIMVPPLPSVKAEVAQPQVIPFVPESKSEESHKAKTAESALKVDSYPDRENRRGPVIMPPSPSVKAEIAQPQFSSTPLESKAEEAPKARTPETAPSIPPSLQRIFSQSPPTSQPLETKDRSKEIKAEAQKASLVEDSYIGYQEPARSARIDNPASPHPTAQNEVPSQSFISQQELKFKKEAPADTIKRSTASHPENSFKIVVCYELQLGAFRSLKQAKSQVNALRAAGYSVTIKPWKDKRGYEWYRIVSGPFATSQEAHAQKGKLAKSGKAQSSFIQMAAVKINSPKMPTPDGGVSGGKGKLAKTVGIEISNGNGVYRMAQMVGNCLSGDGLNVCRLTNASSFNHATTTIYYQKGYRQEAQYLAGYFSRCDNLKQIEKLDREMVKIKILIGKDLLGRKLEKAS